MRIVDAQVHIWSSGRPSGQVALPEGPGGPPRQAGTSHRVYRTPWPGDPRVNIQDFRGMAKPYQVRQVLRAIDKLERGDD